MGGLFGLWHVIMLGSGYRGWQGVGVINCRGDGVVLGMAGGRSHPSPPPEGEGIFCWGLVVVAGGDGRTAVRPYGVRGDGWRNGGLRGGGCGNRISRYACGGRLVGVRV